MADKLEIELELLEITHLAKAGIQKLILVFVPVFPLGQFPPKN